MPTTKFRSGPGSGVRVKAVTPKRLRTREANKIITQDMVNRAKGIKKDYAKTTAKWDTVVRFRYKTESKLPKLVILIGPKPGKGATIYRYLDLGTKGPYPIPKPGNTRAKALYFQWGGPGSYKHKTKPRKLTSTGGGPTGPFVTFKSVMHPGIKARKFSETIARRWGQLSRKLNVKIMEKVAKATGHGMKATAKGGRR